MALTMTLEELQKLCRDFIDNRAKNDDETNKVRRAEICRTIREWVASGGEIPEYNSKKLDIPPCIVGGPHVWLDEKDAFEEEP